MEVLPSNTLQVNFSTSQITFTYVCALCKNNKQIMGPLFGDYKNTDSLALLNRFFSNKKQHSRNNETRNTVLYQYRKSWLYKECINNLREKIYIFNKTQQTKALYYHFCNYKKEQMKTNSHCCLIKRKFEIHSNVMKICN